MRVHRPRPLTTVPTVSVVIPCYNYGRYLPDAVASALDQNGLDVRVLIVDDASTDGSADVARALTRADSRVDVLVHETNRGHIATYNDGLALADGDYVVLLSADDLLMPGSLTRSVALMEAHRDVVLVYGLPTDFTDDPPTRRDAREWWSTWSGEAWIRRTCARGRNIIVNPEVVLRGDAMRELVGYSPAHPHAADMELWMRAACRGRVGRVNGPVQAAYRVHGNNMHVTTYGALSTDAEAVRAVFDDFFGLTGDGRALPHRRRLHSRSARALAAEAVLATGRRDLPQAERTALARFARETWPEVTNGLRWRTHRPDAPTTRSRAVLLHRLEQVRWALRWQRWQRIGT